mmetsp:Transcript_9348/g.8996  ORF Transcript_9348/g.8996 Transcript_9348/m.8996 type:complete len:80 (-) Transcript_9348:33-272(-)
MYLPSASSFSIHSNTNSLGVDSLGALNLLIIFSDDDDDDDALQTFTHNPKEHTNTNTEQMCNTTRLLLLVTMLYKESYN